MKTPSIDSLYIKINNYIHLVEAYLEIKGLAAVMKAARIKPYAHFFDQKPTRLIVLDHWFDEFGNSLKITKKKIKLIYNDLSLDRGKIINTDIYDGLSLDRVIKMSQLAYLTVGKDEDLYQDCYILTLLGLDNYLRTYVFMYGEWKKVAPLLLGIETLLIITQNAGIKYFRQLNNKEKTPVPCVDADTWLVSLPAGVSFLSKMKEHDQLIHLFGGK
jgi:hypothetical protein